MYKYSLSLILAGIIIEPLMRSHLLRTILLLFLTGCKGISDQQTDNFPPLYTEPFTVALNLKEGYTINILTGDSISPLVNSLGDTIKTGIPYSIAGKSVEAPGIKKPVVIEDNSKIIPLEKNEQLVKGNPDRVPANPEEVRVIPLSTHNDSIILSDSSSIVFVQKPLRVTAKKITLSEPEPIKIQPMRYMDNALFDIQCLDIGQGLPYSYITAIHQDKYGYIWLGTDYGFCKYDGTYLTVYTERHGLINNKINSIAEDNQGRLWIGTFGGLTIFDGTSFLQFTDKDGLLTRLVNNVQKDPRGKMWVTVENTGTIEFDGNTFILYATKNKLLNSAYTEIFADNRGNLWLTASTGLLKYNGKDFVYFNQGSPVFKDVTFGMDDSKGITWFSTNTKGLIKFDGKFFTRYTTANGLSDNSVTSWMIDKDDNIWAGTRFNGLNKFNGKQFIIYRKEHGLSENKIASIIQDNQANIWIGTAGGGVNKLSMYGFSEKFPLNKLESSRVRPIIKDKSELLWFGTEDGGLYSYSDSFLTKHIQKKSGVLRGFRSVFLDKENNLWFGENEGSGFYKYDYKSFRYYSPPKISSNLSLFIDDADVMWAGTSREGVATVKGSALYYYNEANGFSSNRVFVTRQDKKGNLWFGTEGGGLVKYDGKTFNVFSEKQGLFCKSVTCISEDADGNLWLGTIEAGLCRFDGNRFTYYTEKQGLAFNSIWSVKVDGDGQIWAGTDNGLSVLIPEKKSKDIQNPKYSIYSFGLQDGLKATDFNLNSVIIDDDNRIWWGTGKALITRDLNMPFQPQKPLSVKINHLQINESYFDFRNLSDSIRREISFSSIRPFQHIPEKLILSHRKNHIGFHISAIEWKAPHKIKYSYRLLGLDNSWSTPSAETYADFRNLPHGNYEFQVIAIGESKEWTKPTSYWFTIRPPWWLTWWFKSIAILSLAALVFLIVRFIYRYQLRRHRVVMEKQLAVQMERQRISSEMHDDIGAGLSGVRLLTELTKSKLKDGDASGEVDKIYQSVGELSAKMKEVIWSLNTDNDSLGSLIAYLQKQSRTMMENYPGVFEMIQPETIPDIKINGDARRHIHLLVKEALHNTIKHSGANIVKLSITYDEVLRIIVADNGKGLNGSNTDCGGNGMKNMRQRISQLNGFFLLQDNNGLIVTFEIPLK